MIKVPINKLIRGDTISITANSEHLVFVSCVKTQTEKYLKVRNKVSGEYIFLTKSQLTKCVYVH